MLMVTKSIKFSWRDRNGKYMRFWQLWKQSEVFLLWELVWCKNSCIFMYIVMYIVNLFLFHCFFIVGFAYKFIKLTSYIFDSISELLFLYSMDLLQSSPLSFSNCLFFWVFLSFYLSLTWSLLKNWWA